MESKSAGFRRSLRYPMRKIRDAIGVMLALGAVAAGAQQRPRAARTAAQQSYALAVASFAPLNSDVFIADADGRNERPFLPDRARSTTTRRSRPTASGSCSRRRAAAPQTSTARGPTARSSRSSRTAPRSTTKARCRPTAAGSRSCRAAAARPISGRSSSSPAICATSRARRAGISGRSGRPTASGSRSRPTATRRSPKFTFATLHSTELYVVRPDGTGLRRLTQRRALRGQPAMVGGRQAYLLLLRGRSRRGAKDSQPATAARDHSGREARRRGRSTARADDRSGREVDAAPATLPIALAT